VIPRIVITSGEPAGIGPDLCVMLTQCDIKAEITIIGDKDTLKARATELHHSSAGLQANIQAASRASFTENFNLLHIAAPAKVQAGKLDATNSSYVLRMLQRATAGCISGEFDAMVTAPVNKGIINDAGISFSGHTEYLAELTKTVAHTPQVVMMLVGGGLRVALTTTHLALKDVPAAITRENLETTIRILHKDLIEKFGLKSPRILVAGLNPHAGEDGYLGREEIDVINPVLNKLRTEGMQLIGALPADTLFTKKYLDNADCVLAMYHDQGLPVLKHASFGQGVNVTLGLPIIRTSVDHGTALDLAGTGKIEIGSMLAAIELAIELVHKSQTKKTE
jgi:4-hydroxythreonine-4-phosphate dehydrogenase